MPARTTHPSPKELMAFSLGQLPLDAATVVESHISECQPCCQTLLNQPTGDTFVDLLKEAEHLPANALPSHEAVDRQCTLVRPTTSLHEIPAQLAKHPRYEIVRLIGKGGMGDVYEALHRKMERRVALKVINRDWFQKSEAVNRFHREVKTAAQLSHHNVVTAFDADQADDFHFMVMEFVDGVDLSRIVKDKGPLPVADACDYIRQAAVGLQHAHERGMVHRDIKPHNLMVTADGTIKILDFGLASLTPAAMPDSDSSASRSDLTAVGAIMGTPDFISPEQANDARQVDIRSDIYSLGATLYFLLSGRAPFSEGSVIQKLKSHADQEPTSLLSLRDDMPTELQDIVAKMMKKAPDQRFQTPDEVAKAMEQLLSTHRAVAQPSQRRNRRWPWIAVATTLLAVIFAGTIFYVTTNNGTVRVEVLDDSLEVTLADQTIQVADGATEFTIRTGAERQLVVRHKDAELDFETERFRIRRGDEIVFKVDFIDGEIVVEQNGVLQRHGGAIVVRSESDDSVAPIKTLVSDQQQIQGTWQVIYSEDSGRIAPQEMLKDLRFIIDEETLTTELAGQRSVAKYKLDPSSKPKAIDLTESGRTKKGIYDLVGDTLRICAAEGSPERPTAFDSQPNSANDVIIMLKRIRPPVAVTTPAEETP